MWHNNDRDSFSSVNLFYSLPRAEEEIWQLRKKPEDEQESIELQVQASNDDLSSLDSWAQTALTRSSVGSTVSLDSGGLSSQNTTPGDSPVSTPTTRRKLKPALKLNLDNVTWTLTKDRRHRRTRLRQNLQAGSAKVMAVMKQSKTPQFRFRMILLTLFGIIVTIVSFTWHMYQRQLLQLAIGGKIRFHEARRVLHLLREDGEELVEAVLGAAIPADLGPYHCDEHPPFAASHMCEEWKYRAKLHINFSHTSNLSCYHVHWESLAAETVLRDCINLRGAHWYGMGLQRRLHWPLQPTGDESYPFVTGDGVEQMFGGIVDRYWLSSDGVAVMVEPEVPLHVALTKDFLCLESKGDSDFPYQVAQLPLLSYTICTGGNTRTLHRDMMLAYRRPLVDSSGEAFLTSPVWVVDPGKELTQRSVQDFANRIMEHTSRLPGFLLFDSRWQQQEGSLDFHREAFPNPKEILKILGHKGFRVMLAVHPYVCLPSHAFSSATEGRHLVSDSWRHVPLLNRWHRRVCGLLDLTSNATAHWFLARLLRLKKKYNIDGFLFTGGQTTYLPRSYSYSSPSVNPDAFLPHYLSVAEMLDSLLGTEIGFLTQHVAGFVRLTPRTVSWDSISGLGSIIPEVLTLGILGYPLVNSGSVGGDTSGEIPSRELYLRWMQVVIFLPVVQFTITPGTFDQEVVDMVYRLFAIRQRWVLPVFREALHEYPDAAAPLVRPLWWIAPNDPHAQTSDSQFLVGDKLMVAPVLEEGRRSRDIYLPAGWWKDRLLGETRRGGKWLHNYPVPLTKVAYFSVTEEPL